MQANSNGEENAHDHENGDKEPDATELLRLAQMKMAQANAHLEQEQDRLIGRRRSKGRFPRRQGPYSAYSGGRSGSDDDTSIDEDDDEEEEISVCTAPPKYGAQPLPPHPATMSALRRDDGEPRPRKRVSIFAPDSSDDDDQSVATTDTRRQANAELWALLHQSKARLQRTNTLESSEDRDDHDEEDEEGGEDADDEGQEEGSVEEGEGEVEEGEDEGEEEEKKIDEETQGTKPAPQEQAKGVRKTRFQDAASMTQDEKKADEQERREKRKFQKENKELWALLQKSKQRLEEAAMKSVMEAEKAAIADGYIPNQQSNPYKDIKYLPDQNTASSTEGGLSQKDLLIAMAVAEEAARSGKDVFETPSRSELRTRDIDSFDFLKEPASATPISTVKERQKEENRLHVLSKILSFKWDSFRLGKTTKEDRAATRRRNSTTLIEDFPRRSYHG